jgi:hypothetical protein
MWEAFHAFPQILQVYYAKAFRLSHDRLLPDSFQFINHPTTCHYAVSTLKASLGCQEGNILLDTIVTLFDARSNKKWKLTHVSINHFHCNILAEFGRSEYCLALRWTLTYLNDAGIAQVQGLHFQYLLHSSVAVKTLCYKHSGFEFRWGDFLNLSNPSRRTRPWGLLSLQQKWVPET